MQISANLSQNTDRYGELNHNLSWYDFANLCTTYINFLHHKIII